jgi:L-ascorbate metabolism protein UlaG (beta-lactamase superfamily)
MKMIRGLLTALLCATTILTCIGCQKVEEGDSPTPSHIPTTPVPVPHPQKTVLYQMPDDVKNDQMMSYIIRTKEDKVILVDGGYDYCSSGLILKLKEITGKSKPVVDAWFMTHPHSDHIDAFSEIMKNSPDALQINHVYYNFHTRDFIEQYEPDESTLATYDKFMDAIEKLGSDKVTVVKEKDVYQVGSVMVEVLITPNVKATSNAVNESSVIYRFTMEGQRVIFLGDAYHDAGSRLTMAYNKDMTCDVIQMAHHGSQGLRFETYKRFKAKVCLWPTPDWLWENNPGSGYNTGMWETIRLYNYMRDLGVKQHYVSKDGIQELVFPIEF